VNNDSIATRAIAVIVVIAIGIILLLLCCCGGYFFIEKKKRGNVKDVEVTDLHRESSNDTEVNVDQLALSFSPPSADSSFLQQAGISRHQELSTKFADLGVASVEDFVWFGKNITNEVLTQEIGMSESEISAFRNASVDVEQAKICQDSAALGNDESADFLNLLHTQRLLAEHGAQSSNGEDGGMPESPATNSNNGISVQGSGIGGDFDVHKVMNDEELASFELLSRMQEMLSELHTIEQEIETTDDKVETTSRLARRLDKQYREQDVRRLLHIEHDLSGTSPLESGDHTMTVNARRMEKKRRPREKKNRQRHQIQ